MVIIITVVGTYASPGMVIEEILKGEKVILHNLTLIRSLVVATLSQNNPQQTNANSR